MSAPQARETMRLLVIDPDQGTAAALGGLLRGRVDNPFQADWVGDVEGALRLIEQQAHDVWLIDHEFDRAERGALVNAVVSAGFPPLVLLGGHRDASVEESVIAAGAADFMWKEELSAPLLQSALRYALGVRERFRL